MARAFINLQDVELLANNADDCRGAIVILRYHLHGLCAGIPLCIVGVVLGLVGTRTTQPDVNPENSQLATSAGGLLEFGVDSPRCLVPNGDLVPKTFDRDELRRPCQSPEAFWSIVSELEIRNIDVPAFNNQRIGRV